MKKRTLSKLKSFFGSKKGAGGTMRSISWDWDPTAEAGKRHHPDSTKSSRSQTPEPEPAYAPVEYTPPPSRVGPPPSPPVPTHPIAPVPPEPTDPVSLQPCPVCSRTFVPQSLSKHVKICEKAAAKRRKTFDSSRQRREGLATANGVEIENGTDLAQFLPKNYGLPENSPFLEKSPPVTSRPTLKPKPCVKNIIRGVSKGAGDLQRCPHCNRTFGVRAFERHVEWCADKAKILPAAAAAQPPPHIADAKQRLNARTQYKAPPVGRNRRSSTSRDKSNSRSASVDSSRGVSPPPPREYGDYKLGRVRASESASSNDHDEMSPHVPIIRNSRNSGNSSSDVSVKARQARLARDLSNSRPQNIQDLPIQQSTTNPENNAKPPHKPRNKLSLKKEQQLKKLEEISKKYSERQQKLQDDKSKREDENAKRDEQKIARLAAEKVKIEADKTFLFAERRKEIEMMKQAREDVKAKRDEERNARLAAEKTKIQTKKAFFLAERLKERDAIKQADKSQIPVLKKLIPKRKNMKIQAADSSRKEVISPKPSTSKYGFQPTAEDRKHEERSAKVKPTQKHLKKMTKASSMSLDSLEDPNLNTASTVQSVGINTELLCPCKPCVIHEPNDSKKKNTTTNESSEYIPEPKVELLFKNLTMVSSCDIRARNFDTDQGNSATTLNVSSANLRTSEHFVTEERSTFEKVTRKESPKKKRAIEHPAEKSKDIRKKERNKNLEEYCKEQYKHNEIEKQRNETLESAEYYEQCKQKVTNVGSDNNLDLSPEYYEEQHEHNASGVSEDSAQNNFETQEKESEGNLLKSHGSGDTYTKFTGCADYLEEFMNITDKMMSAESTNEVILDMDKEIETLHTPQTNSIEGINDILEPDILREECKVDISETFEKLKNDLQELITVAGEKAVQHNLSNVDANNSECEEKRKVSGMEHITVYELEVYEDKKLKDNQSHHKQRATEIENAVPEFKLPSIAETNKTERKGQCTRKKLSKLYKPHTKKYKMLGEQSRTKKEYHTYIIKDNSDAQSISTEGPPLKLPRIENKPKRLNDDYDPFACAARQMKELMSSDTNIPKSIQNCKNLNSTLPILRPKEKPTLSHLNKTNPKIMKDSINKTYQKTPTLHRMKSFGSTNIENTPTTTNTFGARCSSFRLNRDKQKSSQKLNETFTNSSKENISTTEKKYFNRSNTLNRSFSTTYASAYSTPKPKEKIPKISTSYHSFQRTTIKQPIKLDKIKIDENKKENTKKDLVSLDAILVDDNSSMTDSNYIDPRLINENDNLPINVNTILNNPDIISSMESLLTTENLPAKFESFSTSLHNNNILTNGHNHNDSQTKLDKIEKNNNMNNKTAPNKVDHLSAKYDKIMSSLEQSIVSKTSIRDDDSLCEDFDLEEFMTSFDEEIHKHKDKRICSSTTRILNQSDLVDSNRNSEMNSVCSTPKGLSNGLLPVNKSNSLNFSNNVIVGDSIFPSTVKRSTSLLDSIQKKAGPKPESGKSRHKADQLEQDIMLSLKEFDSFYESQKTEKQTSYQMTLNGTAKRESRVKPEKTTKKSEKVANGNYTPNGKNTDSAYSSLNRISPSKLSVCNSKESSNVSPLEQITGSDSSGCQKNEIRSVSSDEFLAMERSAELEEPPQDNVFTPNREIENPLAAEKRVSSRTSSRRSSSAWRPRAELSSSESEASLHARRDLTDAPTLQTATLPRLSRFCHECGSRFPVDTAKFCIECGVKRLLV